jgi:hypothetical protein
MRLKNYIRRELYRYVYNIDTVLQLEKAKMSSRASEYMQKIFKNLTDDLQKKDERIKYLEDRVDTLISGMARQQRIIMSYANDKEDEHAKNKTLH